MTGKRDDKGPAPLPAGYAWRRAALQLVERLGALPGDRALVLAPPTHDPAPGFAARLPRVQWLQVQSGPFGWSDKDPAAIRRIRTGPGPPPLEEERIDALVVVLAVPLLSDEAHARLVQDWTPALSPYGKWLELASLSSPRDPRIATPEKHLKDNGYLRVRTTRLTGGGTLVLVNGRKG